MSVRRASWAAAIAGCLLAGATWAQPLPDAARARAILRAVELDAKAIRATSLPMETVLQEATKMQNDIDQLPALLGAPSPEVTTIEVAMHTHAASLVAFANYADRFQSAGAADDLLVDVARLREAVRLPR